MYIIKRDFRDLKVLLYTYSKLRNNEKKHDLFCQ